MQCYGQANKAEHKLKQDMRTKLNIEATVTVIYKQLNIDQTEKSGS